MEQINWIDFKYVANDFAVICVNVHWDYFNHVLMK
jgi:hypothetical protein